MAVTKNIAEAIRRKLQADPDLAAAVEAERFNVNIGAEIYQARTQAGLTQKELADRVGMHQSAIARLEDADYDGHSLKTLERIALAVGKRVRVAFVAPPDDEQLVFTQQFPVESPKWDSGWDAWNPEINTGGSLCPNGYESATV
jgi:transcriptional regulator with XRE-family HTH domain